MTITPKKDKPITIRIDEETHKKIEHIAIQNKSTISYEIRKMIDYYLESREKLI